MSKLFRIASTARCGPAGQPGGDSTAASTACLKIRPSRPPIAISTGTLNKPAGLFPGCSILSPGGETRDRRSIPDPFRSDIEPLLPGLPQGVIHNDGNDYNVLVEPSGDWGNQVSGVIDFGDMVHSCRINELAVACAYAMLDKADH